MNTKSLVIGLAVAASLGSTAKANLVINGGLERPDTTPVAVFVNSYPTNYIPNWAVHGAGASPNWNAVYIYDTLTGGAPSFMPASYRTCDPSLGFQAPACANPDGPGHFINLDGDPDFPAAISQMIGGLTIDQAYRLTFDWAAVQRNDRTGAIIDNYLDASLGDQHFLTPMINLPSQGFSGWFTTSYDFKWDGKGTVLNFLAHGMPSGLPPSINLDRISLNAIPEPPMLALLIAAGFGLVGVDARRRRRQTMVAN